MTYSSNNKFNPGPKIWEEYEPAWNTDDELLELADKIVRTNYQIKHKNIPVLRDLIEAVCNHDHALTTKNHSTPTGHVDATIRPRFVTRIQIVKCTIVMGSNDAPPSRPPLKLLCNLGISDSRFLNPSFHDAVFDGAINIQECDLGEYAQFWGCTFNDRFEVRDSQINKNLIVKDCIFCCGVNFSGNLVLGTTYFIDSVFNNYFNVSGSTFAMDFYANGSTFAKDIIFDNAESNGKIWIDEIELGSQAALSFQSIRLGPGASIAISTDLLGRHESADSMNKRLALAPKSVSSSVMRFVLPNIDKFTTYLSAKLGRNCHVGRAGHFLVGETDTNVERLKSVARDYAMLRDVCARETLGNKQSDLCGYRYRDLERRIKHAELRQASAKDKINPKNILMYVEVYFDWIVNKQMLGYLTGWHRILLTCCAVIVGYALLYYLLASPESLNYYIQPASSFGDAASVGPQWQWNRGPCLNSLYYSVNTFSNLGYGDIKPTSWLLKIITSSESLIGVLLVALFVVSWARKIVR